MSRFESNECLARGRLGNSKVGKGPTRVRAMDTSNKSKVDVVNE